MVVDDPTPHIWDKQLRGLATLPEAALTRLTVDKLMTDAGLKWLMKRLIDEA
ncbi:hypothetical protein [Halocatena marina]|uniref:hypothetical protein n=1 Tax=Halocatena marina TaxID=2934937 RepID=UPI00200F4717|nr:hypothetical protein [Halocatena marina]